MSDLSYGWQLHQQKRIAEAERIYRKVLECSPHDANAWCYLGIALNDQRQYTEAAEAYRKALSLNPQFPIALNNLGNTLRYLDQVDDADQCFQQAIELKPDYFNAHKNRGTLHAWAGNLDQALCYYAHALGIKPDDAELHRNLGVIYLLQGRFREGWQEYAWRWQVGDMHRVQNIPVWDGSNPAGKSIILTTEQGLGDTIQFVRFAILLRQRGAQTLVYCQPQLLALLQQSPELGVVYPNNLPLPQSYDFQCSLMDVAQYYVNNVETIPAIGAYLRPSPGLRDYWHRRFPKTPNTLRVGIAWQGNPDHQADTFRSIALSHFEPLSRIEGVQLVSLQRGFGVEQLSQWQGKAITQLDASIDTTSGAFMDTAAIVQNLDLVITSDTSIAHLSASMGTPTWIALNYVPDWRWLRERSSSPWYPSARLFRQKSMGDWKEVFLAIEEELRRIANF